MEGVRFAFLVMLALAVGPWSKALALGEAVPSALGPAVDSQPRAAVAGKSAGRAVLFSALVPGGGQVYTGNWWKACLLAPAEVTLGALSVRDHTDATEALRAGNEDEYVRLRNRRNAFLWWTGAVLAFSMGDAYVSAQMYGFDRQMTFALGPFRAGVALGM